MNEMAKEYSARLGLDLPLHEQYINYLSDLSRLEFGYSIAYFPRTVNEIIADSIIWSLGLVDSYARFGVRPRNWRRSIARLVAFS